MHTMIGRCVSFHPKDGRKPAAFDLRDGDTVLPFKSFHDAALTVGALYAVEFKLTGREWQGKRYVELVAETVLEFREPVEEPQERPPTPPARVPDSMIPPGSHGQEKPQDDIPF